MSPEPRLVTPLSLRICHVFLLPLSNSLDECWITGSWQPALIIFKLENYAPFPAPLRTNSFCIGCIVCLSICFCLRRRTHTREHTLLLESQCLEIAADCLTSLTRVALAVSKPLPPSEVANAGVCLAHGTILCSHCH